MLPKTEIPCPNCSKELEVIPAKVKKGNIVQCPYCKTMVKFKSNVLRNMDNAAEGFSDRLKKKLPKYNK